MNFNEYTEKRNALIKSITEAHQSGDLETYEAKKTEIDGLDAEWDKNNATEKRNAYIESLAQRGRQADASVVTPGRVASADVDPRATMEYRNAFWDFLKGGRETRGLSMISGPDGAYALAPAALDPIIFAPPSSASGLTSKVRMINLTGTLGVNGLSITARNGQFFKGTQATIGTTTESSFTFKQRKLSSWPFGAIYACDNVVLNNNVMGDGLAFLGQQFNELIDEKKESYFWYGNGNAEPLGILVADDMGVPSGRHVETGGTGGKLTILQLTAMQYKVRPRWRNGAEWFFNKDAMVQIDGMTDSTGQPVIKTELRSEGLIRTLFGYPINETELITTTANASTGLFADDTIVGAFFNPKAYVGCQPTVAAFRTSDQRLFEKNQTLIMAQFFLDGGAADPEAFAVAKIVA